MKKITFIVLLIFMSVNVYSQNLKTKTQPEITGNIAYFIENKLFPNEKLGAITPNEIESINSIKKDTIINGQKYTGQIFVVLKSPLKKEE
jgi:hypothetical protein